MTAHARLLPIAALLVAGLLGCSTAPAPQTAAAAAASPAPAAGPAPIRSPYDPESLLGAVVQLDWFAMSADYFFQFVETGDEIFEEYLTRLFGLETTPYEPGQATRLVMRRGDGPPLFQLEKALLESGGDGAWWQVVQSSEIGDIAYQVLLSPERVPLLIRYVDPLTQAAHEVPTLIGESLAQVRGSMTPEQIRARLDQELREDLTRELRSAFGAPAIVSEEVVETAAGRFTAVHVRDAEARNPPGVTDYWLSPDVPGGILRISSRLPDAGQTVVELEEIGPATRLIDPASVVPVPERQDMGGENLSEGSSSQPVEIALDEVHPGSVGPDSVSYYALRVPVRADVHIEVSDLQGDAELYFYGADPSFGDWVSANSGSTLNVEDYFVPAGSTLYFAVVDYADDDAAGERYTITAYAEYLLDGTGIRMRGDYRTASRTLAPGGSYRLALGSETLEYYKSVAGQAGTLLVRVTGLPEDATLGFAEVDGEYSNVGWEAGGGVHLLRVEGLGAGDTCYYYVVGAPGTAGARFQASVRLQ